MDSEQAKTLIDIATKGNSAIPYCPEYKRMLGSVSAAILLRQMMYWAATRDYKPFYKFMGPCGHEKYNSGDDWQAELAFGRTEFETARSKIATKVVQGFKKKEWFAELASRKLIFKNDGTLENASRLVLYWTDSSGVTWYGLNEILVALLLEYTNKRSKQGQATLGDVRIVQQPECDVTCNPSYPETNTETITNEGKTEEVAEPTTSEREVLAILKSVDHYKFDFTKDLLFLRRLLVDFPSVDLLAEAKKWRDYKLDKPLAKNSSPRSQFRNWVGNSAQHSNPSASVSPRHCATTTDLNKII